MKRTLLSLVSVAWVVAACGANARALGEACVVEGVTEGECQSGGICGKDTSETLTCLKICDSGDGGTAATCAADQECNGVSGTNIKACRNKKK